MTMSLSTINEMHDRQIAATALVLVSKGEIVQLVTCDIKSTKTCDSESPLHIQRAISWVQLALRDRNKGNQGIMRGCRNTW
jgi:hypothetical protein